MSGGAGWSADTYARSAGSPPEGAGNALSCSSQTASQSSGKRLLTGGAGTGVGRGVPLLDRRGQGWWTGPSADLPTRARRGTQGDTGRKGLSVPKPFRHGLFGSVRGTPCRSATRLREGGRRGPASANRRVGAIRVIRPLKVACAPPHASSPRRRGPRRGDRPAPCPWTPDRARDDGGGAQRTVGDGMRGPGRGGESPSRTGPEPSPPAPPTCPPRPGRDPIGRGRGGGLSGARRAGARGSPAAPPPLSVGGGEVRQEGGTPKRAARRTAGSGGSPPAPDRRPAPCGATRRASGPSGR